MLASKFVNGAILAIKEHREIINSMLDQNVELGQQLIETHIERVKLNALEGFS